MIRASVLAALRCSTSPRPDIVRSHSRPTVIHPARSREDAEELRPPFVLSRTALLPHIALPLRETRASSIAGARCPSLTNARLSGGGWNLVSCRGFPHIKWPEDKGELPQS